MSHSCCALRTKQDSIPAAEEMLPRSLCPLIKSRFGFAMQDSCPYLAASDLVVADTTCDWKKKMYELLAARKPVMLLQLPQSQDEAAFAYWRAQYVLLVQRMGQDFGVRITEDDLQRAMDLTARLRHALKRVLDLAKRKPAPLRGMDLLDICFRASFMRRTMSRPSCCWTPYGRRCRRSRTWPLPMKAPASC